MTTKKRQVRYMDQFDFLYPYLLQLENASEDYFLNRLEKLKNIHDLREENAAIAIMGMAARKGYKKILRFMFHAGADLNIKDNYIYKLAVEYKQSEIIKYLNLQRRK